MRNLRNLKGLLLAAAVVGIAGAGAHATLLNVPNSGFESPTTASAATPDNWTGISGFGGSFNPYTFTSNGEIYAAATPATAAAAPAPLPGTDGKQVAFVYNA